MDRFHRYYALHGVLAARRLPVSRRELESKLECSRLLADTFAPLKRKIEKILAADHFGAGELPGRVRILRMGGRGPGGTARGGGGRTRQGGEPVSLTDSPFEPAPLVKRGGESVEERWKPRSTG